jgi:hypothetical protein
MLQLPHVDLAYEHYSNGNTLAKLRVTNSDNNNNYHCLVYLPASLNSL